MPEEVYDREKLYVVTGDLMVALVEMTKLLYSPLPLTPDQRRDIANFLYSSVVMGGRVEGPYEE